MLRTLLNFEQRIISKRRYDKFIKPNLKLINGFKNFEFKNFNCIFCSNNVFEIICDYDKFLLKQKTVYCKKCGLIQSNPRMTDNAVEDYYSNDYYRKIHSSLINQNQVAIKDNKSKKIYNLVNAVINFKKNDSVLEIGSYTGYNLVEFKNNNLDILGIDLSLEASKIAQKNGINVQNISLLNLNKKFKLIMLVNVLEHFNDPESELIKIKKNMQNDSFLFIALPQIKNFSTGMLQQAHCHYYKKNDFIHLLSICGFKLIKFGNYSKDHMYGIFSVGNDLKKNNFSNLYETKYILYSRYFKFYKLIFFIFRNILNKFIYRK